MDDSIVLNKNIGDLEVDGNGGEHEIEDDDDEDNLDEEIEEIR